VRPPVLEKFKVFRALPSLKTFNDTIPKSPGVGVDQVVSGPTIHLGESRHPVPFRAAAIASGIQKITFTEN
jgi:hypothetical protein